MVRAKRLYPKRLYHYIDVLTKYRPIAFEKLQNRYTATLLEAPELILAAKKLHGEVYLRRGFVARADLVKEVISPKKDPYQHHSLYFGVIDKTTNEVVAVARQIEHDGKSKLLPVLSQIKIKKNYDHLLTSEVVEISAFVKKPGVDSRALLLLFYTMLQHSKKQEHRYWLLACDEKVYRRLKSLFGPVLHKIGPTAFYLGSNVVPAEIDIDRAPKYLKRGYLFSLPPLRRLRRYLYTSFTDVEERIISEKQSVIGGFFWDMYSRAYDGLLHFHPYRHLIQHVCEKVLALSPKSVLDLGCGTGNLSLEIIKNNKEIKVDAVDWSSQMIKRAEDKLRTKRVRVYERDLLLHLTSSRKKYNVIVMNNVLYTIKDRPLLWKLISRRLTADGYVVIANPDTANSASLLRNHYKNASIWHLFRARLVSVWIFDGLISLSGIAKNYDFTKKEQLLQQLEEAGFVVKGSVERCYGGHTRGIDLLLTAARKQTNEL